MVHVITKVEVINIDTNFSDHNQLAVLNVSVKDRPNCSSGRREDKASNYELKILIKNFASVEYIQC